jgi:hypothetical protein
MSSKFALPKPTMYRNTAVEGRGGAAHHPIVLYSSLHENDVSTPQRLLFKREYKTCHQDHRGNTRDLLPHPKNPNVLLHHLFGKRPSRKGVAIRRGRTDTSQREKASRWWIMGVINRARSRSRKETEGKKRKNLVQI